MFGKKEVEEDTVTKEEIYRDDRIELRFDMAYSWSSFFIEIIVGDTNSHYDHYTLIGDGVFYLSHLKKRIDKNITYVKDEYGIDYDATELYRALDKYIKKRVKDRIQF